MIYLELFLTFLKIGVVSFGGGYGMISLIREDCLAKGWLSEGELLNFIAVAESTPGPIAVNMATFVGSSQGGVLGAFFATLGIVLPSFIIILLIAAVFTRLMKYAGVKATIRGIKPAIIALIIGTAITMLLSLVFGIKTIDSTFSFDYKGLVILAVVAVLALVYSKLRKKAASPIILILISGALGVILYGV
ncbi:MAG: chromate transporter [Clostridia bacterium]|nr:chromate transporter [Clostridia bacterium]